MLYLEKEEIRITSDGMMFQEVKKLYNTDKRNESKPFFKKCLMYIYWAYKKDGELCNHIPSKRKEMSAKMAETTVKEMESNVLVNDVIKLYINNQMTLTERLYFNISKDVESLLESISNTPLTINKQVEVMIDIPRYEGSVEMVKYPLKTMITITNAKEKGELLKMSETLIEYEERLKKKIIKETQLKKNSLDRIYDNKKSNI